MEGILHEDVTVNDASTGSKIVETIMPDWYFIKHKVFDEGITNKLYGYYNMPLPDGETEEIQEIILLRLYGNNTDYIIDRKKELENHIRLHKAGYASKVYCTVNNGYFYGFVNGGTLTVDTVRDPTIAPLIAKAIAGMHAKIPIGDDATPVFHETLVSWLRQVPAYFEEKLSLLTSVFENKAALEHELHQLQEKIASHPELKVGFCHNDLLLGNIIYNKDEKAISFIDYEYGNTNYFAFEIGNHFDEYAGVDNVDFSLYPDRTYQLWWLRFYLEEYHARMGLPAVTDQDVALLLDQVNFFSLCGHIWWGIWSIVQSIHSDIDFDFADYARLKLQEYLKQKKRFFDLL